MSTFSSWQPLPRGEWQSNEGANACPACYRKLGAFRRRHHCRCCGRVFCADCTSATLRHRAAAGGVTAERVCNECHAQVTSPPRLRSPPPSADDTDQQEYAAPSQQQQPPPASYPPPPQQQQQHQPPLQQQQQQPPQQPQAQHQPPLQQQTRYEPPPPPPKPSRTQLLAMLLLGIALCFFGGEFLTLVAAAEAVRLSSWQKLCHSTLVLYRNYERAVAAVDGDAAAERGMNDDAKRKRELRVVLRSIDPAPTADALAALCGASISVVATVRLVFARCLTLGTAVGDMTNEHLGRVVEPIIRVALPSDLRRWSQPLNDYMFKSVGVTLAFCTQPVISALHASLRGGKLIATAVVGLGLPFVNFAADSQSVHFLGLAVAVVGYAWQLYHGFRVPFPINVLLAPFFVLEWTVDFFVYVL
jgi:hypothetical protein